MLVEMVRAGVSISDGLAPFVNATLGDLSVETKVSVPALRNKYLNSFFGRSTLRLSIKGHYKRLVGELRATVTQLGTEVHRLRANEENLYNQISEQRAVHAKELQIR